MFSWTKCAVKDKYDTFLSDVQKCLLERYISLFPIRVSNLIRLVYKGFLKVRLLKRIFGYVLTLYKGFKALLFSRKPAFSTTERGWKSLTINSQDLNRTVVFEYPKFYHTFFTE